MATTWSCGTLIDSSQGFDLPTVLSLSNEPHSDSRSPNHRRWQDNHPQVYMRCVAITSTFTGQRSTRLRKERSRKCASQMTVAARTFCCRSHASLRRKGGSMLFRAADWRFVRSTGSRMSRPLPRPLWESDAENPACVLMTDCLPQERRRFEKSRKNGESCCEAGRPL
jgi:hypothetical protein